jgi:predicted nuclease of restriction endonuclease-like (RecB) superfamily
MKKSNIIKDKNYLNFIRSVKERIYRAQYEALKKVNKELLSLYWDIGRMIVDKQNKIGWGKSVVENVANDLQMEFPAIKGFSIRNLWNMRNYYYVYKNDKKLQTMSAEIGWSHNIAIMEKCKENLERKFYLIMTKKYGWTYRVLINQIENQTYEKYLLNQTNFDNTLPEKLKHQAKLAVKDDYIFDFLELNEEHSERQLELSLISSIRKFLIEMGRNFTFIGSQFKIEVDGEQFFIDLLLFHRVLKSLIAIDLKIGKFIPEFAGKMQFYLSVLDNKVKLPDESPSIGIIICKDKNRTIVEYALKDINKPIGVATYKIRKTLPAELKGYIPSPKEIEERLEFLIKKENSK